MEKKVISLLGNNSNFLVRGYLTQPMLPGLGYKNPTRMQIRVLDPPK